jgi:tripartite-type tricarboxylate transporter receptor subunit TctC
MKRIAAALLALAAAASTLPAQAAWPERPVRFIVPFAAGGPADNAMRIVGKRLAEIWGQPVVVENKPGAPGMTAVATAPPDGYTFLLGAGSSIVTTPLVNKRLAYKPQDFAPVCLMTTSSMILTVSPALGVKTLKDFVAYAKSHPGRVNYSSTGMGSPGHLLMEMFEQQTGTAMTHVPYKGSPPAIADIIAGFVQAGINATPSVIPHVNAGKLLPLAVVARTRDPSLPNVPTMAESGVRALDFEAWYGLFAPAKTPQPVIEKVSADVRRALAYAEVEKGIQAQGNQTAGGTPQQLARRVQDEIHVWDKLVRERKLTLDE